MTTAVDREPRDAPTRGWIAPILAGAVGLSAATHAHRRARRTMWTRPGGRVIRTPTLSTRLLGDGGPPVLLLHGLVASGIYWGGAYDRLAAQHRLVVPDLLGFGHSPRPVTGYGPDDHADAVVGCLDALGIDAPVVIGAHSLGTLIALRLASSRPERVAAIVAFGPPIYPDPATATAHVGATSPMGRLFVLPGRTAEIACRWVCDHRELAAHLAALTHPGLPREIAADAVQHSWASYSETLALVVLAAEATTWLERVRCPVHLVAGDSDPVVDHDHLRRMAELHPGVTLRVLPGRHDLPVTHATDCASMIAAAPRPGS
ncbi:MAG: alpha/beta hydrolase [Acidimicrobiales bacterium]